MSSAAQPKFVLIITILVLASSISIMSTDIYSPSLPHLPSVFDTNANMVKLTISLNLMMFGVGQMIHGPLSDRFGRKPVLLAAIFLFTVFSFICALAQDIHQLIIARMLQGLMGAAEAVIGLAVFKDLFNEKQQVRALAIFGMSIALAPAVAPIIGGYVHVWFGWQFNFYFIGVLGMVTTFLIWRLLPESSTPQRDALRPSFVLGNYYALLTDKDFITYTAIVGVGAGVIYAFVTGGPFVMIDQLGVPTERFGYYQALIVGAYFVGSLFSTRAVNRMDTQRLLNIGIGLLLVGGIGFVVAVATNQITPYTFTTLFCLMTCGLGPVFAVAPAKALLATTRSAGATAAMLGGLEMLIAGSAAGLVSVLHGDNALAVTIAALMVAMIGLASLANRRARAAIKT